MNGRLYDPKLHRFIQPDDYVQEPYNSQNYNRYAYGLNNPLVYTDKSGKIFWLIPVLVGAAINVITNGIENRINGQPFFQGAWKAGITGAVTGAVSFGIGTAAQGITNTFGRIAFQTVAHGYLGGFSSVANGGDLLSGMASGALGSLAATGTGKLFDGANKFVEAGGTILSGGLMGGVGAEIAGGNFWDGARNGLISAGLNHAAHMLMEGDGQPKPKKQKWDLNGDGKLSKYEADQWFLHGNGKGITVDNRYIDWDGLTIPDGKQIGEIFGVETHRAFMDLPFETAATYGGTSFERTGISTVKVIDQAYHYNMRPYNSFRNVLRNIATIVGYPLKGTVAMPGKPFNRHYANPTIRVRK